MAAAHGSSSHRVCGIKTRVQGLKVGMKTFETAGEKVTVVAIAKNEARYVLEWVAHYRRLGAADVIVFDNESADATPALLERLQDKGILRTERISDADCTTVAPQIQAYLRGMELARTDWILFCDIDEFLHLEDAPDLDHFVMGFGEEVSVVVLNWRAFGSSGLRRFEDRPVTERFTVGSVSQNANNRWVKSLARRDRIARPGIHVTRASGLYVHADGSPFTRAIRPDGKPTRSQSARIVHSPAALAHFGTKSKAEFDAKIARGRAGVNTLHYRKATPTQDAEIKWTTFDVNEVEIDWFVKSAAALRLEIERLKALLARD